MIDSLIRYGFFLNAFKPWKYKIQGSVTTKHDEEEEEPSESLNVYKCMCIKKVYHVEQLNIYPRKHLFTASNQILY